MSVYDNIAKNLKQLMSEKKATSLSLSKAVGTSASIISRFLNRDIVSINLDLIIKIADFFKVDMLELLGEKQKYQKKYDLNELNEINDFIDIYNNTNDAGEKINSNGLFTKLPVTTTLIEDTGYRKEDLLAVKVTGDAMEPTLKNGDYIITLSYNPSQGLVSGVYAIEDSFGGVNIKRLDADSSGNINATVDNKLYDARTYSKSDIDSGKIRILEKVFLMVAGGVSNRSSIDDAPEKKTD